jgi:hypothetical protein
MTLRARCPIEEQERRCKRDSELLFAGAFRKVQKPARLAEAALLSLMKRILLTLAAGSIFLHQKFHVSTPTVEDSHVKLYTLEQATSPERQAPAPPELLQSNEPELQPSAPLEAQAPAARQNQAVGSTVYLLTDKAFETENGVNRLSAGAELRVLEDKGDVLHVASFVEKFDVLKNEVSNDPDWAREAREARRKSQKAYVAARRQQAIASVKEHELRRQTEQQAFKEQPKIATRPPIGSGWENPLNRGAYNGSSRPAADNPFQGRGIKLPNGAWYSGDEVPPDILAAEVERNQRAEAANREAARAALESQLRRSNADAEDRTLDRARQNRAREESKRLRDDLQNLRRNSQR